MRQITLRGIPEEITSIVKEEAKNKGVSLNKAFISLLRKGVERQRRRARPGKSGGKSEFSQFLGLWKEEDAEAFDRSLREQRTVDAEIWS